MMLSTEKITGFGAENICDENGWCHFLTTRYTSSLSLDIFFLNIIPSVLVCQIF